MTKQNSIGEFVPAGLSCACKTHQADIDQRGDIALGCPQTDLPCGFDIRIEELLLWTYQRQKADLVIERGVGLFPQEKDADGIFYRMISGDGTYQIHRNYELGIKLEGCGFPTCEIHPDAEMVHELIKTKSFTHLERGLLIEFGKTGLMPDWMPGAQPQGSPQ